MYTIHIDKLWSLLFPPFWSSHNCRSNVILSVKWIWIWANVIHRTFGDLRRNANFGWSWKYICGETHSIPCSKKWIDLLNNKQSVLQFPISFSPSTIPSPSTSNHRLDLPVLLDLRVAAIFQRSSFSLPSTVPSHRNWWRLRRWYPRDNDLAKPRQNSP